MENDLFDAFERNDEPGVMYLLHNHPEFDPNSRNIREGHLQTILMHACNHKMVSVVKFLMDKPQLDVNAQDSGGDTAIFHACQIGSVEIVKLLLINPNVKLDLYSHDKNHSPLWVASIARPANHGRRSGNHTHIVKLLIASGHPLGDFEHEIITTYHSADTLMDRLTRQSDMPTIKLLENFLRDQDKTRFEVQMELGMTRPMASNLFGMVVFLCDGLVLVKDHSSTSQEINAMNSTKFFDVVQKFPMELQMMISNFAFGINEELIKAADREKGLKDVARSFLQERQ